MKKCNTCGLNKSLYDYCVRKISKDGLNYRGKDCDKLYRIQNKENIKKHQNKFQSNNPNRQKEIQAKYVKVNPEKRKESIKKYLKKYPEKQKAKAAVQYNRINGFELHHWSYNQEHWKDVIPISQTNHIKIHKYMSYNKEKMMYCSTITNGYFIIGELLNTKNKHQEFINQLLLNLNK